MYKEDDRTVLNKQSEITRRKLDFKRVKEQRKGYTGAQEKEIQKRKESTKQHLEKGRLLMKA